MLKASVIRAWLDTLSSDASVCIDEGGLTLIMYEGTVKGSPYLEVGGIPEIVCRECGGAVVPDPDGSEGVFCHADDGISEGRDIDADHVPIPE